MRWILALLLFMSCAAQPPCPLHEIPSAPLAGPGATAYPHASVTRHELSRGWFDSEGSVIIEPAEPRPAKAPVVFFLHGYFDASTEPYETMLEHIARKGFIVIYPGYGNALWPKTWAANAEGALMRALAWLDSPGHVQPDRERLAFVGHSLGGMLSLHLAQKNASARFAKIPQPRLIITLDGAGMATPAYPFVSIDDLSRIPKDTWLLLLVAETSYQNRLKDPQQCLQDKGSVPMACNAFAVDRRAYLSTTQIPKERKAALLVPSEHNATQGTCGTDGKPVDAIDTWGYWKLTVGALSHVLQDGTPLYAFQESAERRAIGPADERPKKRPIVAIDLCLQAGACPR